MKQCFKCGEIKPLQDYYKHKMMGDGHLNKCKQCTKDDVRARESEKKKDPDWVESEKDRHRLKYHRLEYREIHKPTTEQKRKIMERYKAKFPEKIKAAYMSGRIKPQIKGSNMHHWSYNEKHFRDVIELTVKDHNTAHRYMVYDQERKMYRTANDGILLDTRELHVNFINGVIEGVAV